ncbi:unnamed protein product [Caenorhabditis bovis]|uniref:Uncharacterized protein n=1 Tax=Caenorhabditis bovis TaxID=2654633 RepID=A0A8S1DZT8_9PELO|nr:unnamed protein product [Caenorhabditis bovis]
MLSESRECIVPNEAKTPQTIDTMDKNNHNRRFDDNDELPQVRLSLGEPTGHRKRFEPLSESALNLYALIIAATIGILGLLGLVIAVIILAYK